MYVKFIKNSNHKNLFFNFILYNTLTTKLGGNALANKKVVIFFSTRNFCCKTTFNIRSFNKFNDFVSIQYSTAIFYPFHLNP